MSQTHIERIREFRTTLAHSGWYLFFQKDEITLDYFTAIAPNGSLGLARVPESGPASITFFFRSGLSDQQLERLAPLEELNRSGDAPAAFILDEKRDLLLRLTLQTPDEIQDLQSRIDPVIDRDFPTICRALENLADDATVYPYVVYQQLRKVGPCRIRWEDYAWKVATDTSKSDFIWAYVDGDGVVNLVTELIPAHESGMTRSQLLEVINSMNHSTTFGKISANDDGAPWLDFTFFLTGNDTAAGTTFDTWLDLFRECTVSAREFLAQAIADHIQEE